jgi:hypothetical protein
MVRWTSVVGVFTVVLAVVGGIQAWAFIQSERAFLNLDDLQISGGLPEYSKPLRVFLTIKNSGHSAAFVKNVALNMGFQQLPERPEYKPMALFAIGPIPGNSIRKSTADFGVHNEITRAHIEAIKAGTFKMFIFGFFDYTDDFSIFGQRTVGFCYTYDPLPTAGGSYDNCTEPNYTYTR